MLFLHLNLTEKVLFATTEIVNEKLKRLKKSVIIKKEDYSKWVAPMVCSRMKNNKIRLCTNFSAGLNNCLKTCHHPLLTPEDIFVKLSSRKIFSKLDLSDACSQSKVNDILKMSDNKCT